MSKPSTNQSQGKSRQPISVWYTCWHFWQENKRKWRELSTEDCRKKKVKGPSQVQGAEPYLSMGQGVNAVNAVEIEVESTITEDESLKKMAAYNLDRLRFLGCALGIFVCYFYFGILQERMWVLVYRERFFFYLNPLLGRLKFLYTGHFSLCVDVVWAYPWGPLSLCTEKRTKRL